MASIEGVVLAGLLEVLRKQQEPAHAEEGGIDAVDNGVDHVDICEGDVAEWLIGPPYAGHEV